MLFRLLSFCCLVCISNVTVAAPPPGTGFEAAFRTARIRSALNRWESASRNVEPVTVELRNRLLRRRGQGYSAHALLMAAEFHGPVTVAELRKSFHWHAVKTGRSTIQLTGSPRDRLERLFVRQFRIQLDADSGLPTKISFITGNGKHPPAVAIRARTMPGPIRLINATRSVTIPPRKRVRR